MTADAANIGRLVVFTRWPEPGRVKTRLIPVLGAEGAARLHRAMTEHTLARIAPLAAEHVEIEVCYDGASREQMESWLGGGHRLAPQASGDLGTRMENAVDEALAIVPRVVVIGTDAPGVRSTHLRQAFEALESADLVLGPAADGGYWTIGLRRRAPLLFRDVPWSTPDVLACTLDAASRAGLATALLETLRDVDRPEDLEVWQAEASQSAPRASAP